MRAVDRVLSRARVQLMAGAADHAGSTNGHPITFNPDHPMGADQLHQPFLPAADATALGRHLSSTLVPVPFRKDARAKRQFALVGDAR